MAKRWKKEDLTYLKRYAGTKRLEELATRFKTDTETVSARLEELARELRDAAHGIGAEGMMGLAEQISDAARSENYEKIGALLTHMGLELDWLMRILDENRCSGNL